MNKWVVLAILAWGCWGFFQKNASMRMSVAEVQLASFISTAVLMPVYFHAFRQDWSAGNLLDRGTAWAMAANVFSISASYFYLRAVKTADTSTVTLATSCYPVITFILAAFFLGERVTVWKVLGIPVVIFGIWISGRT